MLEQLERDNTDELVAAIAGAPPSADPMAGLRAGLDAFLRICRRPEMVRIALSDAPAVLGWDAWRELEAKYGLGPIVVQLEAARRPRAAHGRAAARRGPHDLIRPGSPRSEPRRHPAGRRGRV
ncbi:hypothetical protein [Nocardia harenae]|uniref:hypothetical protein n=1 Tax=Nocardia harenae TaxID=358707 RepID=UPI000AB70D64|nr:hypothetical protein [Nocardia harenae]